MSDSKLIVCSVRLPVTLSNDDNGWQATVSPGGLATALRSMSEHREFSWVGYPGAVVEDDARADVSALLADQGAVAVYLDEDEYQLFYEEFSNRVLWPLFHGLPGPRRFSLEAWECYKAVNEKFADRVSELAAPGDTVWVHDYQLMLVPQLLRERGLDCAVGFFLHIPFPASDIYRTLPKREAILRGVLGADMLGFHTYEYVSNFRASLLRVAGVESEPESVNRAGHVAQLGVLPIGIDPAGIDALREHALTQRDLKELQTNYEGQTTILGVDRLDYTKGLPEKLLAYELLLQQHPELHGKVTMIQVAAPSRSGVAE